MTLFMMRKYYIVLFYLRPSKIAHHQRHCEFVRDNVKFWQLHKKKIGFAESFFADTDVGHIGNLLHLSNT